MKLTYLYHSGFSLESDSFSIIIDFFEDTDTEYVRNVLLSSSKPLYVLSTHSHHDHFNREILTWKHRKENITYIFSKEILDSELANKNDAIYLNKFDEYKDDFVQIKAYGSTDAGVSFAIKAGNLKLFHAGDLNNWHWNEESTAEEIKEAEGFYKFELSQVANDIRHLDLAMFPIDPRLGKDFMKGATQFIEAIQTDRLIPMHFSSYPSKVKSFEAIAKEHNCEYICLIKKGDFITL